MGLVPFASVDRSAMRWLRDREHPDAFSLLAGDATVLTLEWRKGEGSFATARSALAEWTLKRGGFLNPHITVRSGASLVARLSVHLNYHEIEIAEGRSYRFHRAGVLLPAWQVSSPEGSEVLHIEPAREGRHLPAGAVVVAAGAVDLPELLLLATLAWYFIVLAWFEDEAIENLHKPLEGPEPPGPGDSR